MCIYIYILYFLYSYGIWYIYIYVYIYIYIYISYISYIYISCIYLSFCLSICLSIYLYIIYIYTYIHTYICILYNNVNVPGRGNLFWVCLSRLLDPNMRPQPLVEPRPACPSCESVIFMTQKFQKFQCQTRCGILEAITSKAEKGR